MDSTIFIRGVFLANIVVAGVVGALSLFAPTVAARIVFSGAAEPNSALQIVGSFWTTIALLSLVGLFFPLQFSPVLLVQLIYKGLWLLVVALPATLTENARSLPTGVAIFFAVSVVLLPLVIPFRFLFKSP